MSIQMMPSPIACGHRSSRILPWPARTIVVGFVAVGAWYLVWRLGTLNPHAWMASWLLWIAELYGYVNSCLFLWMVWRVTERHAPPPSAIDAAVDVLIPTLNEPVEIARRTILCALRMKGRHEIWLLDDGNRPALRRLAGQLNVHYLARPTHEHAKAGNLNYALGRTSSEFVAVLDVDHCPAPEFLERTIGWLVDAKVAFVQTAHAFYNLDSFQHFQTTGGRRCWHEQSMFYEVIQPGKDVWNAAIFCGSGAVLRRSALRAVGGFAQGTITEDMHTSLRLHRAGWKSVYLPEPLAFGIAPQTLAIFLRQRIRWTMGNMQVWRQEGILSGRGLNLSQRICYFASLLGYFEGWCRAICYMAPLLTLLFGILPVRAVDWVFIAHLLPYYGLGILAYIQAGRGHGWVAESELMAMARFGALMYATVGWMFHRMKFRVTPKTRAPRDSSAWWLIPQMIVLALSVTGIAMGVISKGHVGSPPWHAILISAGWAMFNGCLAWGVIALAWSRDRDRRSEYRFIGNRRAVLRLGGQPIEGDVIDLSPRGFGCEITSAAPISVGLNISGHFELRDGPLPFEAIVRGVEPLASASGEGPCRVGCEFVWPSAAVPAPLELELFGNDEQWRARGITNGGPALVER